MSNQVGIPEGSLVLLSGLPGAGKSFLKSTAQGFVDLDSAWLSMDALRVQLLGERLDYNAEADCIYCDVPQSANATVYGLLKEMVEARLSHGRTCILDATWPTDGDRKVWAELAQRLGVPFKVLILDTPLQECLRANRARVHQVPERVIRNLAEGGGSGGSLAYSSRYPHQLISRDDVLVCQRPLLQGLQWDVVGDVHGLTNELLSLLQKVGWKFENNRLRHPDGRKLLFLGDLVDRGYDSLGLLRIVRNAVQDGVAVCLAGNHEEKLLRFWDTAKKEGIPSWSSYSNALTGMQLLASKDGPELVEFLRKRPAYQLLETADGFKFGFVHANLKLFYPGVTSRAEMLHGHSGRNRKHDTDAEYQERFDRGLNRYTLIRGHIPQTSKQQNIYSLERQGFQQGALVLLQMDRMVSRLRNGDTFREAFEQSAVTQACDYDFATVSKRWECAKALEALTASKSVYRQMDSSQLLRVYKYSKKTFWENGWSESPWLMKARGIVLDAAGTIVSHPFDKVFNFRENGAGDELPDDTPLVASLKLNGHLGIISAHPHQPGKLLVHTQGSFEGDHVRYIHDYLPAPMMGRICKYLSRNDVTLMFEVLHPEDPHIIEASEQDYGLWLIGVRGKKLNDQPWTEELVDEAASEMGLRRPSWVRTTKAKLLAQCRSEGGIAKVEGWMARADTPEQPFVFKLKTPYYLTTKFLGRLSAGRIKHMYANKEQFKQTVDEEFYGLVDMLVSRYDKEQFLGVPDTQKVQAVRQLIDEAY